MQRAAHDTAEALQRPLHRAAASFRHCTITLLRSLYTRLSSTSAGARKSDQMYFVASWQSSATAELVLCDPSARLARSGEQQRTTGPSYRCWQPKGFLGTTKISALTLPLVISCGQSTIETFRPVECHMRSQLRWLELWWCRCGGAGGGGGLGGGGYRKGNQLGARRHQHTILDHSVQYLHYQYAMQYHSAQYLTSTVFTSRHRHTVLYWQPSDHTALCSEHTAFVLSTLCCRQREGEPSKRHQTQRGFRSQNFVLSC